MTRADAAKLAVAMDDLAYSIDWYEYMDSVDDRAAEVERLTEFLAAGDVEYIAGSIAWIEQYDLEPGDDCAAEAAAIVEALRGLMAEFEQVEGLAS